MKRRYLRALSTLCAAGLLAALLRVPAGAQEQTGDWRAEFEAVCVKTDLAMSLSSEELTDLVARCDRLAERIGLEADIVRKVYLRRLQSCRSLFVFVLETRSAAPAAGGSAPAPPPTGQPAASQPGTEASTGASAPPPALEGKPAP
jgi:hypothetical protein